MIAQAYWQGLDLTLDHSEYGTLDSNITMPHWIVVYDGRIARALDTDHALALARSIGADAVQFN